MTETDIESCAVLTTNANHAVAPVHDRVPVLIDERSLETWLDPRASLASVQALLHHAPGDFARVFEVSKAVNSPANDSPALLGDASKEARLVGNRAIPTRLP